MNYPAVSGKVSYPGFFSRMPQASENQAHDGLNNIFHLENILNNIIHLSF